MVGAADFPQIEPTVRHDIVLGYLPIGQLAVSSPFWLSLALLEDPRGRHSCTPHGFHSAPVVATESRNRCRDAAISASASDRPTHSAPSTLLPGSRSL